jgi:hypothetical protein
MEDKVPAHILAQVHTMALEGLSVERISFLLRLDEETIEEELRNPSVGVNATDQEPTESPSER